MSSSTSVTATARPAPTPPLDTRTSDVVADRAHRELLDRTWRIATRTSISLALVIAAAFPAFTDRDEDVSLWGFAGAFANSDVSGGERAFGWFVVAWTVGTLVAVALTLLVPPSSIGPRIRMALASVLGCFTAGHALLLLVANDDSAIRATYGWSVAAAGVLCVLWASSVRETEHR